MFDFGYYTKTTNEVLKVVENLKFKGYKLLNIKNTNGDYEPNSFTWKKRKEYLRLYLVSEGFHEKRVFSWKVDFNFKPYNKKKCDKWKSEEFKGTAEDLYLNRFYEAIKQIKLYLKKRLTEEPKNFCKMKGEKK